MPGERSHEDNKKVKFSKERSSDFILRIHVLLQLPLATADLMRDLEKGFGKKQPGRICGIHHD